MVGTKPLVIVLSFPPTVNHYWLQNGKRKFIGKRGVAYRHEVFYKRPAGHIMLTDKLIVSVDIYPPDKRRRDIDNLSKCLLDSLQHAQIFEDDFQVDELHLIRRNIEKPGKVIVSISVKDYEC